MYNPMTEYCIKTDDYYIQMMRINERKKKKTHTLDPKTHLIHESPETNNKSKYSA